jgi:hypothetical protein
VRPFPAYIVNRTSDIIASNPEALTLLTGIDSWPAPKRNTIRYVFLHPAARDLFHDWDHAATTGVANLHAALSDDPAATDLAALVTELRTSPEFTRLWDRYDVKPRRSQAKRFHHPAVGDLTLAHEVLRLDDGRRLAIYSATPGSPEHDALMLLSMGVRSRYDG